jgi:hypothetical protein
VVSPVVGSFDLAGGLLGLVRRVMEQRVCQRSADALVEEDKHECGFDPIVGETVAVAPSDAFEQAMGFPLAKVIAELGEGVGAGGQAESGEDGLLDVGGPPAVELGATALVPFSALMTRILWLRA